MDTSFEIKSEEERDTLIQAIRLIIDINRNEEELGRAIIKILSFVSPTFPIKFRASYEPYYNVVLNLRLMQTALKYIQDFINYNTKLASRYVQHPELVYTLLERVNSAINEWKNT